MDYFIWSRQTGADDWSSWCLDSPGADQQQVMPPASLTC